MPGTEYALTLNHEPDWPGAARSMIRGGDGESVEVGPQGVESWLSAAHWSVGTAGVLAFLGTGLYMRRHFPAAYQGHEAIRFVYRANHLYIMFASIVNVALGRYFAAAPKRWQRAAQILGSVAVIVAVPILVLAFFNEPQLGGTVRTTTLAGCILALSGALLHGVAGRERRPPSPMH